ncbi:MAG: PAS domain-containing protein [Verrucomicrobiota bacterium]
MNMLTANHSNNVTNAIHYAAEPSLNSVNPTDKIVSNSRSAAISNGSKPAPLQHSRSPSKPDPDATARGAFTVLVVDDNATDCKVLSAVIESEGHHTLIAQDGIEAMAMLDQSQVDLIISDILMPRMDGFRLCYEVRRNPAWKQIPLIVYTSTYTDPADEKLSMALGASKYLKKPAGHKEIIAALNAVRPATPPVAPKPESESESESESSADIRELAVLRDYSERLVAKLEERNLELEKSHATLKRSMQSVQEVTEELARREEDLRVANQKLSQFNSQFQELLRKSPAVLYALRVQHDRLVPSSVTENIERMTGFTVEEALAPTWWLKHLHPEDRAYALSQTPTLLKSDGFHIEYRFQKKNGSILWVLDECRVLRDASGNPVEIIGSWTDITERKKLESEVALRERRLNAFFQSSSAGLCILDTDSRYLHVNDRLAEMHGLPASAHVGRSVAEIVPDLWPNIETQFRRVVENGESLTFEISGRIDFAQPETRWWQTSMFPIFGHANRPMGVGVIVVETTEQKRAEKRARELNHQLELLLECLPVIPFTCKPDGDFATTFISASVETLTGFSPEKFTATSDFWLSRIHPEDKGRVLENVANVVRDGRGYYEYRWQVADGSYKWFADWEQLVRDDQGQPTCIAGNWVDITERKKSEQQIAVQHRVTQILGNSVTLLEAGSKLLEAICQGLNWTVGALFAVDPAANGLCCEAVWHPPSTEFREFSTWIGKHRLKRGIGLAGKVLESGEAKWIEDLPGQQDFPCAALSRRLRLHGAVAFPICHGGEVIGVLQFMSNQVRQPDSELMQVFTALGAQIGQFIERKHLESQLRQSQKMEAIGQLAGGIAHDLNNLLTVIQGFSELLIRNDELPPAVCHELKQIFHAGARASSLTQKLLVFSRKQAMQLEWLDLNAVLADTSKILRRLIPENIAVEIVRSNESVPVLADHSMIDQLILNLAINARDAIATSGRIALSASIVTREAAERLSRGHGRVSGMGGNSDDAGRSSFACLTVSDNGCGIEPEILPRIFEPFFTTKEPGKGTGMGLATVFGIVKQHQGWIDVESRVGSGTQFSLYLPLANRPDHPRAESSNAATRLHGHETILLVEDEEMVRGLATVVLKRFGYEVIEAGTGELALEVWKHRAREIDLVLTDVIMPGSITGPDLADLIHGADPSVKFIFTSGYSSENARCKLAGQEKLVFLQKPYHPRQLAEMVRAALDG